MIGEQDEIVRSPARPAHSGGMEYNETSQWACLGGMFPQLRRWAVMTYATAQFSQEQLNEFCREARIAELFDTINKVEAGELPPSALQQFKPRRKENQ